MSRSDQGRGQKGHPLRWAGKFPATMVLTVGAFAAACASGDPSSDRGAPSGGAPSTDGNTPGGAASGGAPVGGGSGGAPSGGTSSSSGGVLATGGGAPTTTGGQPSGGTLGAGGSPDGSGGQGAAGAAEGSGASEGSGSTPGNGGSGGSAAAGGGAGGTAAGGAPTDCDLSPPTGSPLGYGKNTTGGGSRTPQVVRSFAEAEAALDAYHDAFQDGAQDSLVLHYAGSFDFSTITDVCAQHQKEAQILSIKEVENVTFYGLPGSSANFGIKVNRAKNVIIQNMTMGLLPGGGDADAISIEGNGTNGDVEHVWVDHNDLFSSTKDDCEGAGDTEFDGLIDVKKGARYITISYNHLHDHQKTGLLGHSDTDDMDRYVTFHHNWYQNVVSRTPLHRFGYVHLFNNYYSGISSSGINVRMGGVALIEANFFENAENPITSRYSDEVGYWDLRDNFVGQGVSWSTSSDTLANADDWKSTTTFPAEELTYSVSPDAAECVPEIVRTHAGATL